MSAVRTERADRAGTGDRAGPEGRGSTGDRARTREARRVASVLLAAVGMALLATSTAGEAQAQGSGDAVAEAAEPALDSAVFAGGCFWCMEPPYDEIEGVEATISGYAGGHVANPSYEQVTAGGTGHREAVLVVYDPSEVDYARLLETFWPNIDPFDDGGQFCDRGFSYTSAIFAQDSAQARKARASKEHVQRGFDREIVTPVVTGADFYPAEEYHQDYYRKNSYRYRFYRWNCGRDDRLEEVWGEEAGG